MPQAVCHQAVGNFEATGDYSFNKSHAACYALISYRTAWLKANYPVEYMAALVSSVMNTKDKVPFYVNQCHEMGIEVLPPDVNKSDVGFTVVEGKIRFGLNAVKGVGVGAIEAIVAARDEAAASPRSTTSARASIRRSSTGARSRRSSRAAPSTAPATRAAACSRRCRRRWPPASAAAATAPRARAACSTSWRADADDGSLTMPR